MTMTRPTNPGKIAGNGVELLPTNCPPRRLNRPINEILVGGQCRPGSRAILFEFSAVLWNDDIMMTDGK